MATNDNGKMEVKKVTNGDVKIINDLLINHVDNSDIGGKPPTNAHLQKLPSLYASSALPYLYDIDVLSNHRKKGIGRLLINTAIAHLKVDGVNEIWLGTAVDNIPAQRLFSATGGTKLGETFYDYTYDLTRQ